MKRCIGLFMVMVLLLLAAGCTSQNQGASPVRSTTPPAGYVAYTNTGDNFRIYIPGNWIENSVNKITATFIPADLYPYVLPTIVYLNEQYIDPTESNLVILNVNLTNSGSIPGLQSFHDNFVQGAVRSLGASKVMISIPQNSVINGNAARTTRITFIDRNAAPSTAQFTTVQVGETYCLMDYIAVDGQYQRQIGTVDTMINSFSALT